MIAQAQKISTRGFFYNADTKTLSCEASELREELRREITLVSHRTGAEMVMRFDKCHREARQVDSEGDITHWTYLPVEPSATVVKFIIWND